MSNSLFFNSINSILNSTQEKSSFLWENSVFLQKIDSLIFASILLVFVTSTFASSDTIGYFALITLFLTSVKTFLKKGEKIEPNFFEIALLFYFLIVIISVFGSSLYFLSLKGFLKTFTYLGFYFSCAQYFKSNLDKIWISFGVIGLGVGIESLIGITQNFAQVGEISTWQDVSSINPEDVMTRVYGTLKPFNPNLFGGYLVAGIPAILGFCVAAKKRTQTVGIALALISVIALFLTGCRGAYLGLFVMGLAVFAILTKFVLAKNSEKITKAYYAVITALIGFGTVIMLSLSPIRTRIFSIFAMRNDSSTSFRMNVYQACIEMFKDNWLLGIGVGNQNFREIYGLYMKTGFDALSAYSVFLEIGIESGVFALIAFLIFVGAVIYQGFRTWSLLSLIAVISIIGIMTHGIVDTVFFRPQVQFIFWFMVAIISVDMRKLIKA